MGKSKSLAAVLALACSTTAVASAQAAEEPVRTKWVSADAQSAIRDVTQALKNAGAQAEVGPKRNGDFVFSNAGAGIRVHTVDSKNVMLTMPTNGQPLKVGSTTLLGGRAPANAIALRASQREAQALIRIEGPTAPERYEFGVKGDAARLEQLPNGGVAILDKRERVISMIEAPWAVDARKQAIATHFEIDGLKLIQVVQHRRGGVAYPVVADPWVKGVANILWRCLKGAVGLQSLEQFFHGSPSWKNAFKFVVRRAGIFAAVGCLGEVFLD